MAPDCAARLCCQSGCCARRACRARVSSTPNETRSDKWFAPERVVQEARARAFRKCVCVSTLRPLSCNMLPARAAPGPPAHNVVCINRFQCSKPELNGSITPSRTLSWPAIALPRAPSRSLSRTPILASTSTWRKWRGTGWRARSGGPIQGHAPIQLQDMPHKIEGRPSIVCRACRTARSKLMLVVVVVV